MTEEWRDIKGFEGLYQVSNCGRVKSFYKYGWTKTIQSNNGILKQYVVRGYSTISLKKGKGYKHFQVHRLVASAFIQNPNNLPCVNHKDENKLNNHVSNLEWCTYSYNINYGTRNKKAAKALSIPIVQLTLEGNIIAEFNSFKEAEDVTGILKSHICNVCKGIRHHAGGYKWRYLCKKN